MAESGKTTFIQPNIKMLNLVCQANYVLFRRFNTHLQQAKKEKKQGGHFSLVFGHPTSVGKTIKTANGKSFKFRQGVLARDEEYTYLEDGTAVGRLMPQVYFAGARTEEDGKLWFIPPRAPSDEEAEGEVGVPWSRLLRNTYKGRDDVPLEQLQIDVSVLDLFRCAIVTSDLRTLTDKMELPKVFVVQDREQGVMRLHVIWGDQVRPSQKPKRQVRQVRQEEEEEEEEEEGKDDEVEYEEMPRVEEEAPKSRFKFRR